MHGHLWSRYQKKSKKPSLGLRRKAKRWRKRQVTRLPRRRYSKDFWNGSNSLQPRCRVTLENPDCVKTWRSPNVLSSGFLSMFPKAYSGSCGPLGMFTLMLVARSRPILVFLLLTCEMDVSFQSSHSSRRHVPTSYFVFLRDLAIGLIILKSKAASVPPSCSSSPLFSRPSPP